MKRNLLVVTVILTAAFAAFGQKAAAGKTTPATAVRAAFDRLIDDIKKVDADKVMSAYEKSDRLLIFNNNGSATGGWENVKNNVTESYAKLASVDLEVTGLRIEMLGNTAAYVTCKWKQSQENDGKLESASGRMTLVFKLIGKEWKIVHRHTSPENPGSTRPVVLSERDNQ